MLCVCASLIYYVVNKNLVDVLALFFENDENSFYII